MYCVCSVDLYGAKYMLSNQNIKHNKLVKSKMKLVTGAVTETNGNDDHDQNGKEIK